MKLIEFSTRPNMKYLVHLIIWSFLHDISQDCIALFLDFHLELTFLLLSFLGQFIVGGIGYLYHLKTKSKRLITDDSIFGIKLITNNKIKKYDSKCKIYSLIILAAFFDFVEFLIYILLAPYLQHCSYSLEKRLMALLIIFDVLFYRYVLKLPIFKHQMFSLVVIIICLIITIATEFIFQDVDIFLRYGDFVAVLLVFILEGFFFSIVDVIEKYLFEYDYLNPFKLLMLEGIFSFVLGICYSLFISFFTSVQDYINSSKRANLAFIILSLLLFMILSALQSVFRAFTIKIYSPMASALSEFILNPVYIILTFVLAEDFKSKKNKNLYFSINLILTIIISLCGCIYNEFLILFFWGLQYETHREIVFRAVLSNCELELNDINSCEDDDD